MPFDVAGARQAGWSDQEIAGYLLSTKEAQAANAAGWSSDDILQHFGLGPTAKTSTTTPEPGVGSKPVFDDTMAAANGAVVGLGPRIMAAAQAVKQIYNDVSAGGKVGDAVSDAFGKGIGFGNYYDQALDQYSNARKDYLKEHPLKGPLLEIGGSLPTTMVAGGALTNALRAGEAVPYLGPAARFLGGSAGYTGAGEAIPGISNFGLRVASQGAAGALQGGAQGALTTALTDKSLGDNALTGAEVGGAIGATAGPAVNWMYNKLRGPMPTQTQAELAQRALDQYGIPLKWSNITGEEAPTRQQLQAFMRQVTGTFGENAPEITRQVLSQARDRITRTLDTAATHANIPLSGQLFHDLQDVQLRILNSGLQPEEARPLLRAVQNIYAIAAQNGGMIDGAAYQQITNNKSPLFNLIKSGKPEHVEYGLAIREALDTALEGAAPDAADAIRTARTQYKNLMTVRHVMEPNLGSGELGPQQMATLLRDVISRNPQFYRRGAGQIGDLAEIGTEFLRGTGHSKPLTLRGALEAAGIEGLVSGGVLAATHSPVKAGLTFAAAAVPALGIGLGSQAYRGTRTYAQRGLNRVLDQTGGNFAPITQNLLRVPAVEGVNRLTGPAPGN